MKILAIMFLVLSCSLQKTVVLTNSKSVLEKEKLLYKDPDGIWITDFSVLPDNLIQIIQKIKAAGSYGTYDLSDHAQDFFGTSNDTFTIYPVPGYSQKIISAQLRQIEYRLEKNALAFGDCHNYPLEHIKISFYSTKEGKPIGIILNSTSRYIKHPKEDFPYEFKLFIRFLTKKHKENYNPFDNDKDLISSLEKSTAAFTDLNKELYFIGAIPGIDFDSSQIYKFNSSNEEFTLFKITSDLPCGS